MKKAIAFCGVEASSGKTENGYAVLPHSGCRLPVFLINGCRDGRTLLITAGIHGFEYPGILAARELAMELNALEISGAVIIMPVINTSGFYGRAPYVCPEDEKRSNLNRLAPGDPSGTFGQRLLADLYTEFVRHADFHVDLHAGDVTEHLCSFAAAGNAADPELRRMSLDAISYTSFRYCTQSSGSGEFYNGSAQTYGVPSVLFEAGGAGSWSREEVNAVKSDLRRIAQFLQILPGQPVQNEKQIYLRKQSWIHCGATGFFEAFVSCGSWIHQGDKIYEIRDVFGDLLETHYALHSGKVMILNRTPGISRGDDAVFYGQA